MVLERGRERHQERERERGRESEEGNLWGKNRECRSVGWLGGVCRVVVVAGAGWEHCGGRHGPCSETHSHPMKASWGCGWQWLELKGESKKDLIT